MNVEKIKDAYAILAGIPAAKFVPSLSSFYRRADGEWLFREPRSIRELPCGTLACGAGWLVLHPKFKRQDHSSYLVDELGAALGVSENAFWDLFNPKGASSFDREGLLIGAISDKALLLYRIRRFLGQDKLDAFIAAAADAK